MNIKSPDLNREAMREKWDEIDDQTTFAVEKASIAAVA